MKMKSVCCAGMAFCSVVAASAAPRPFVPLFYGAKSGEMAPFKGMDAFTDAIPSYAIGGIQKPRLRPFTKHSEYRKKYVQRIPDKERRKTPYNITDLFKDPRSTVDSDYARSGKPFFVYERVSRPPSFQSLYIALHPSVCM